MSFVYIAVLAAVLVLGYLAETNPKSHLKRDGSCFVYPDTGAAILLSMVLIAVSGLRYRVGTDYMAYYRNQVRNWDTVWQSILTLKEPGIKLLSYLANSIYDHGQSLIFVSALITVGLYCRTIYRYHNMYLLSMWCICFWANGRAVLMAYVSIWPRLFCSPAIVLF